MKVLVTGAAGFIGSHLCDFLLRKGLIVIGIDDLSSGNINNLNSALQNNNFTFKQANILDTPAISFYLDDVFAIYHLAGKADIVPSINNPLIYHSVNVSGTLNMLELAREFKVKKFIYAASSSCYGIPNSYPTSEKSSLAPKYPYALTKMLGESYVQHWGDVYGLDYISLRLFNVYGTRSRTSGSYGAVLGTFIGQMLANKPATVVGTGEQVRDFIHVHDVVNAFYTVLKEGPSNQVYNIGSGKPQSVNQLLKLLKISETIYIPERPGEPSITHANIDKITTHTSWYPKISFKAGIEEVLKNLHLWKNTKAWSKEEIHKETLDWFKYLRSTK